MWRFLAGAGSALALAAAGIILYAGRSGPDAVARPLIAARPQAVAAPAPLPDTVPAASARTREEKRFDRYDKDRNGAITRAEYLVQRRKAFARLDANGDGRLDFDEWAVKTTDRFAKADADGSGAMSRTEFATTAPKRRAPAKCVCPPAGAAEEE